MGRRGFFVRCSMTMKAASKTSATRVGMTVRGSTQPTTAASEMPKTSRIRPDVLTTAPAMSYFTLPGTRDSRTQRVVSSMAMMAMGTLIHRHQRHETNSVSMPPITRPTAPPPAEMDE